MKLSDTVDLKQVLDDHAEWVKDRYSAKGANLQDERRADLSDAVLRGADLSGADLRDAVLRGAVLRGAVLSRADLRGADLRGADLSGADLSGADLSGADLSGADLRRADLSGADLRDAVLSRADLPTSRVKVENIDERILAAIESGGALNMSDWHTCETTHCRAGWAIALAGEAGAVLEDLYGPAGAGAIIYAASRPNKPIPNFYASTEDAMASIRADAEEAKAAANA